MSRTRHARPAADERRDAVIYVPVPRGMVADLKRRLREERRRNRMQFLTMPQLLRRFIAQGIGTQIEDEDTTR